MPYIISFLASHLIANYFGELLTKLLTPANSTDLGGMHATEFMMPNLPLPSSNFGVILQFIKAGREIMFNTLSC
jgi:hypothetical protein